MKNAVTRAEFLRLSPLLAVDDEPDNLDNENPSLQGDHGGQESGMYARVLHNKKYFRLGENAEMCDLTNYCTLTPICYPIDIKQHHFYGEFDAFFPQCVKLYRCLSSCCDYLKDCRAEKKLVPHTVRIIF